MSYDACKTVISCIVGYCRRAELTLSQNQIFFQTGDIEICLRLSNYCSPLYKKGALGIDVLHICFPWDRLEE